MIAHHRSIGLVWYANTRSITIMRFVPLETARTASTCECVIECKRDVQFGDTSPNQQSAVCCTNPLTHSLSLNTSAYNCNLYVVGNAPPSTQTPITMQNPTDTTHGSAATLRRRRPRRAIGEVSISSASTVYVNNVPAPAANEDVEPVYENATSAASKPLPPWRRHRVAAATAVAASAAVASSVSTAVKVTSLSRNYSVVCRQLDRAPTMDDDDGEHESVAVETQHITMFIGEDCANAFNTRQNNIKQSSNNITLASFGRRNRIAKCHENNKIPNQSDANPQPRGRRSRRCQCRR